MMEREFSALLHDDLVRVYELLEQTPGGYRFGGPMPVSFDEVDWFQALPTSVQIPSMGDLPDPRTEPDRWQEELLPWLQEKRYVKPGKRYLVLCLHRSFVFTGEPK